MRKSGLALVAGLAALILAVHFLVTDRLLERRLEKAAGRLVGARVELEGFHLSLLRLRVHWEGLQVADPDDPMLNLVQTGLCVFDLDLEPLLEKKFIVEDFQARDVQTGTRRLTDGSLPPRVRGEPSPFVRTMSARLEEARSRIPLFNPEVLAGQVDVEGIWESVSLQTQEQVALLRREYDRTLDHWETRIAGLPSREELGLLDDRIRAVSPADVESPGDAARSLQTLREAGEEVNRYLDQVKSIREGLGEELSVARLDRRIASWVQEELERVAALVKIPGLPADRVAEMLFGEAVVSRVERITRVVGTVRRLTGRFGGRPRKEKPPRLAGQDIAFAREQALPSLWIRSAAFSGEHRGIELAGRAGDVTSGQKIIDRPTRISAGGTGAGGTLRLQGVLDHRTAPREEIGLELSGFSLAGMRLIESPVFPAEFSGGTGTLGTVLRVQGEDLHAEVSFNGSGVSFAVPGRPAGGGGATPGASAIASRLADALAAGVSEISFGADIRVEDGRLSFSVHSNLDDRVAEILGETLGEEAAAARKELEARVHRELDPVAGQAVAHARERRDRLDRELEAVEASLEEQRELVRLKRGALESRLNEAGTRAQDELKEDAEKKLEEQLPGGLEKLF
jgi:uncharacterized protein (TIGR03545 family)